MGILTAKAAASTAIFQGVSAEDFSRHYMPISKNIQTDNKIGKFTFFVTGTIQKYRFARHAMLRMTQFEQDHPDRPQPMSTVMWDMFSGSAAYGEIFMRTLQPKFLLTFSWILLTTFISDLGTGSKRPATAVKGS